MRPGLSEQELLGLFEEVYDNEDRAYDLRQQIKAIGADSTERFKAFAQDGEIKLKDVKAAYKYWKDHKDSGDDNNEDYYLLMTMVDSIIEEDEE